MILTIYRRVPLNWPSVMIVTFYYRKLLHGPAFTVLCACTMYFASLAVMTLDFELLA